MLACMFLDLIVASFFLKSLIPAMFGNSSRRNRQGTGSVFSGVLSASSISRMNRKLKNSEDR